MLHDIPPIVLFENYDDELSGLPRGPRSGSADGVSGYMTPRTPMVIWNQSEDPDNMEDYDLEVPPSDKVGQDSFSAPSNPLTLSRPDIRQGETPMA